MRGPLKYYGGKGNLLHHLQQYVPYARTYVEPFCGGASLFFVRRPSPVEVLNDINQDVVALFRVLRDPEMFGRFYGKAVLTPYSRAEFEHCRATFEQCKDEVERAYRFFVFNRQSYCGSDTWIYAKRSSRRGMSHECYKLLKILSQLPLMARRLSEVQLDCQDWLRCCDTYDGPETVFYIDPPYLLDSISVRRDAVRAYRGHTLPGIAHHKLVEFCLQAKGAIVISSYQAETYERLILDGTFTKISIDTVAHSSKLKTPRTEILWINELARRLLTEQEIKPV
jgi:DNA adenine methylase